MIAESKPSRGSYSTWLGEDKPPTVRDQLEGLVDTALGQGCKDFDSFLTAMKAAGVEVKRGKHLALKIPNGKRFIRCDSLGDDYTEAAIQSNFIGGWGRSATNKHAQGRLISVIFIFIPLAHYGYDKTACIADLCQKRISFLDSVYTSLVNMI